MATTLPSTDVNNSAALGSRSSAALHLGHLVESGASERAYGTFEVSRIDVEPEQGDDKDNALVHNKDLHAMRECGGGLCYSQDCCFLMAFLCAPIRLRTYQVVLFHVASFLFAVVASAWTIALLGVKLIALVSRSGSCRAFAHRFESRTLRTLRYMDSALFNFVSPVEERVKVYSSSTSSSENAIEFFGRPTQLYYAVVKLVGSAVPGLLSTILFLWSLQRLFEIVLCVFAITNSSDSCNAVAFDPSSVTASAHFLTTLAQDLDLLVLVALIAVYGATMLLQVAAYISRHITVFFCAEHLCSAAHSR